MALSHLKFFDKKGNNRTPYYLNGVYNIDIHFDPVSTGLFESEHIFVFEEIFKKYSNLNVDERISPIHESLLIRVLERLNTYYVPVPASNLQDLFSNDNLYVDEVEEFAKDYPNFIDRFLDFNTVKYKITYAGKEYLRNYREDSQEETLLSQGFKKEYVRPRSNYNSDFGEDTYLYFRWKNNPEYDENIFLYFIDYSDNKIYNSSRRPDCIEPSRSYPGLVPVLNENLELDEDVNPNWKNIFVPNFRFDSGRWDDFVYKDINERRILSEGADLNQQPIQFNFALHSEIEGDFQRTLEVFVVRKTNSLKEKTWTPDYQSYNQYHGISESYHYTTYEYVTNAYKVAEINFYGEVIGEDERLKVMLENFGRKIEESETYVFKDFDVEEERTDYIKLNEKRKELLINSEEIYPHLGSYKVFVNAIKWFGYSDLKLKEYFYNIKLSDPDKNKIYYSSVEIPLDLKRDIEYNPNKSWNEQVYGKLLNSNIYRKTARFGLTYNINYWTGEYDAFNFPIVEDNFQYTNEEVLIKLFGLKVLLQKYFLPHHARIIDITGEGVYFEKYEIRSWNNINPIIPLKKEENPDFIGRPLIGYIKPLDKLLNIYKINDDIEIETSFDTTTVLSDIINKSLTEWIIGSTDFPFQTELPLSTIQSYYSDYYTIKDEILYHLNQAKCSGYSTESIKRSDYHKQKMLGQPVELELLDESIIWKDMTISWQTLESSVPNCVIRGPKEGNVKIDTYRIEQQLCGAEADMPIFTWDNVGFSDNFEMQWIIRHENNQYCFQKRGLIEDIKKILVFLPAIGKYDVTCVVKDITGFPRITRKRDYLTVLKPEPEFVAFGRYIRKSDTWEQVTVNFEDFHSTWEAQGDCPLETTWEDALITWDGMNYVDYMVQDFVKDDIKSTELLDTNDTEKYMLLSGKDFYDDFYQYKDQMWRKSLVIYRNDDNVPTMENIEIDNINYKTIILDKEVPIKKGEKLHVYRYVKTSNFIINDDVLRIYTEYYDSFEIGTPIRLIQENVDLGNKDKYYVVTDIYEDRDNGYVDLTLEDDGSVSFWPEITHNPEYTYNYSAWNFVEFKTTRYVFPVRSSNYSSYEDKTYIRVWDENSFMEDLKNQDLSKLRAEYGVYAGWYVFELNDEDVLLTENNNTMIYLDLDNEDVCRIDTSFNAYWADYDFDWAKQHMDTKDMNWYQIDDLKFSELHHQKWGMMNYHGEPALGFKIWNINNITPGTRVGDQEILGPPITIIFNGQEKQFRLGPVPAFTHTSLNPSQAIMQWKYSELTKLLNESKDEIVSRFNYYNIGNKHIKAVSKVSNYLSLFQLEYKGGITGYPDTYPRAFYSDYEELFFDGVNNPAEWSYLKSTWDENGSNFVNQNNNPDKVIPYLWALSGSFTYADSFISRKDFTIPKFTQIFVIFDEYEHFSNETTFLWEIREETQGKLMGRSRYRYLIWNFVDSGSYSVKLTMNDPKMGIKTIEKKSWITVN